MEWGPPIALAGLVVGILVGERAGAGHASVALSAGALALALSWVVVSRVRVAVAAVALAMIGCAVTMRALDGQRHSHLAVAIAHRAQSTVTGVVADDPDGGPFVGSVVVRVRAVRGASPRLVLVSATGDEAADVRVLQAGDRVVLRGRLGPLRATGFDQYLRWRHAVGRLDDAQLLALREPSGLFAVADRLRNVILRGTRPLPPTSRALLAGFLLGDTRTVPDDITEQYRAAGLSHLLAVSGANVAFALALVDPLLRRLRLGLRTTVALGVVLMFAAMTRFEPSVLRASVMAGIALGSMFAGRPASTVRRLLLACIALLVLDPFLLHSLGFLLSAAASAGIALVGKPLRDRLPGPAWCAEPLAVSIAAQLGVTPILLVAFGRVPLISPITNLLAAPAASTLGAYGLFASAVGGIAPHVGPLVQQPSLLLVAWITRVAAWGAAMPLEVDRRGVCAVAATGAAVAALWLACTRGRRAVPENPTR